LTRLSSLSNLSHIAMKITGVCACLRLDCVRCRDLQANWQNALEGPGRAEHYHRHVSARLDSEPFGLVNGGQKSSRARLQRLNCWGSFRHDWPNSVMKLFQAEKRRDSHDVPQNKKSNRGSKKEGTPSLLPLVRIWGTGGWQLVRPTPDPAKQLWGFHFLTF